MGEANHLPVEWQDTALNSPIGLLDVPAEIGKETRILMVRPEDFRLESVSVEEGNGIVKTVDFSGSIQIVSVELKSGDTIQVSASPHFLWSHKEPVKINAERYLCFNSYGHSLEGVPVESSSERKE